MGDVFDRAEMAALWAGHDAAVSSIPFTGSDPGTLIGAARTGRFRVGTDQFLTDGGGTSWISFADFAVALVDEIERPAHPRQGFTVGY